MKKVHAFWIVLLSLCIGAPVHAQKLPLTIALQDYPDMMPALVAHYSGYFSQDGLETWPVVFRSGVGGKILVDGGIVKTLNEKALLREATPMARRIAERAGVLHHGQPAWPVQ
jgi:hypothetical protein